MTANSNADIYRRITDQIVTAIEAGAGEWRMPWHTDPSTNTVRPINAVSGKPYRGVNTVALWSAAHQTGYRSAQWATYKQWQEIGAQVNKGERASFVVFWKFPDKSAEEVEDGEQEETAKPNGVFTRGYCVFNAEQVSGYTPVEVANVSKTERVESAEQFFTAIGADIRHGGNRAYYNASSDYIRMPHFEAFREAIAYYSTLGHEMTHWTASAQRLNRDLSGRFGTESYAAEELVAELGAAFLCADLALTNEPRPDHAAYVASWLKVLRKDTHAIFTTASKAQQAIDYLYGLQAVQPEMQMEVSRELLPAIHRSRIEEPAQ